MKFCQEPNRDSAAGDRSGPIILTDTEKRTLGEHVRPRDDKMRSKRLENPHWIHPKDEIGTKTLLQGERSGVAAVHPSIDRPL